MYSSAGPLEIFTLTVFRFTLKMVISNVWYPYTCNQYVSRAIIALDFVIGGSISCMVFLG